MKYSVKQLQKKYNSGKKLKYLFFWGHNPSNDGSITKSCLSQWWKCKFEVESVQYNCAEQYMMAEKAKLFGDEDICVQILKATHPKQMKDLGRKISGFDENVWIKNRFDIVKNGNLAKFSQNVQLQEFLYKTGKRVLVEASPYDKIWGIGLAADNPQVENPFVWNGENLLGFALMEVRDELEIRNI